MAIPTHTFVFQNCGMNEPAHPFAETPDTLVVFEDQEVVCNESPKHGFAAYSWDDFNGGQWHVKVHCNGPRLKEFVFRQIADTNVYLHNADNSKYNAIIIEKKD